MPPLLRAAYRPEISSAEQQLVALINDERTRQGLRAVEAHPRTTFVAAGQVAALRDLSGYRGHFGWNCDTPAARAADAGLQQTDPATTGFDTLGEVIVHRRTPAQALQAWMDSPGHRDTILGEPSTHIGVAHADDTKAWVVVMLSNPHASLGPEPVLPATIKAQAPDDGSADENDSPDDGPNADAGAGGGTAKPVQRKLRFGLLEREVLHGTPARLWGYASSRARVRITWTPLTGGPAKTRTVRANAGGVWMGPRITMRRSLRITIRSNGQRKTRTVRVVRGPGPAGR
jgi:hypothetical protein